MASNRMNFSVGINLNADKFKRAAKSVSSSISKMRSSMLALSAAFAGGALSLGAFISKAQQTVRDLSKAQTTLKNVTGDSIKYGESLKYLNDISKRYNAEIIGLTNNYSKFLASAKGANVTLKDTRNIFESLTQASTFFNLSADETNGVMLAVTQMMSKGKIQAEELRGQLGERLPGALSIMSKALGVTTKELDKLMKDGKLLSKDVLPLFAEQLKLETSGFDKDSIEGSINALKNAWSDMWQSPDMIKAFQSLVKGLTTAMQFAAANIQNIFISSIAIMVGYATNAANNMLARFEAANRAMKVQYLNMQSSAFTKISSVPSSTVAGNYNYVQSIINAENAIKRAFDPSIPKKFGDRITEAKNKLTEFRYSFPSQENTYRNYSAAISSIEAQYQALNVQANGQIESIAAQTENTTRLASAWTTVRGRVLSAFKAIKGFFMANLPGLVIGAVTLLIGYLTKLVKEAKRIKNLTKDTLNELNSTSASSAALIIAEKMSKELSKLKEGTEEYTSKLNDVNKVLNTELKNHKDINDYIKKQTENIIKQAKATAAKNKIEELEKRRLELLSKKEELNKNRTPVNYSNTTSGGMYGSMYGQQSKTTAGILNVSNIKKIDRELEKLEETINSIVSIYGKDIKNIINEEDKVEKTFDREDFTKAKDDYLKGIKELNNQFGRDAISLEEFLQGVESLKDKTYKTVAAFDKLSKSEENFLKSIKPNKIDADVAEDEVRALKERTEETDKLINELKVFNKAIEEYSKPYKERDTTFDYKLTKDDKAIADIENQLANVKTQYDAILIGIQSGAVGLDDIFQELINNAETLQDKLDLAKINKDIKEMKTNIAKMGYEGFKNMASSLDSMVNAFQRIREVNEDTDATNWEKLLTVFNAITQTIDGLIGLFQTFMQINTIIQTLTAASQAASTVAATAKTAEAAVIVPANMAIAASNKSVAVTGALAAASMIPFPGNIAAMSTSMGTLTGLLSAGMLTPFADGGVVSGPTKALVGEYAGAKNNPEVIAPLNKLKTLLGTEDKGGGIAEIDLKLRGSNLYGSVSNYKSKKSKYSRR